MRFEIGIKLDFRFYISPRKSQEKALLFTETWEKSGRIDFCTNLWSASVYFFWNEIKIYLLQSDTFRLIGSFLTFCLHQSSPSERDSWVGKFVVLRMRSTAWYGAYLNPEALLIQLILQWIEQCYWIYSRINIRLNLACV